MVQFFLNRPVFTVVLFLFISLLGFLSLKKLPVEQFPSITPINIKVSTYFPGASAETIASSVAAPLEQGINGVENMLYMYSQSSSTGWLNLVVSFAIGTDPNTALINTQNRVNLALSSLPPEVRAQGVSVTNEYPDILLFVAIESEQEDFDQIFLSNYANTNIANELERLPGVSVAVAFNARDYSMRIWIRPDRLAQFKLTAADVIRAVEEQNNIRSIGFIGAEPINSANELTLPVNAKGRLQTPEEFENIILKANLDGSTVLLKDVSRIELGAQSYNLVGNLNRKPGAYIGIYQESNANALDVATRVKKKLQDLSQFFPKGVSYQIPYDTTDYIKSSIWHVEQTLVEAALLVSLVIFVFLHNIRLSLVPIIAMFVSIIGTFTGMYLLGFSINMLTLFGLILAVGIVVDDAIIVVENIERHMREKNSSPKEAAYEAMKEVISPVIATALVLAAVFIPVSFIGGIPGEFFKQFAITIAASAVLSAFVALTLTPVTSAMLLKKIEKKNRFGLLFDQFLAKMTDLYGRGSAWLLNKSSLSLLCLAGIFVLIFGLAKSVQIGFVPEEDQGLLLMEGTLPDGASLKRVEEVVQKVEDKLFSNPNVEDVLSLSGYSFLQAIPRINYFACFVKLKDWKQREEGAKKLISHFNQVLEEIPGAEIAVFNPPSIPGIGVIGSFNLWILNEKGFAYETLQEVVLKTKKEIAEEKGVGRVLTSIDANNMQLAVDLNMTKAESLGLSPEAIYQTLQVLLGSIYINQFNQYGNVYQVIAQAEPVARDNIEDIGDVYVRSKKGDMIPLKSLLQIKLSKGPNLFQRFNGFPAALITTIPSTAGSQELLSFSERIAKENLPAGMSFSWGGLGFQEKESGGISYAAFLGSLVLTFLVLAALYERWLLPIAILMAVPFGILGAFLAIWLTQSTANIYFQIGIVALIGLSAKNAILIVEFAKQKREEGKEIHEAALEAAKIRFRAIIMTSLTVIIGALPLVITSGAGAISRKSVGTGIIGGMVLATFLAIFFVPVFYQILERLSDRVKSKEKK